MNPLPLDLASVAELARRSVRQFDAMGRQHMRELIAQAPQTQAEWDALPDVFAEMEKRGAKRRPHLEAPEGARVSYGIWREPAEESVDLYPGLVVHDGRQTGSITTGRSRLPVWAFISPVIVEGWSAAEDWEPSEYGWTGEKMAKFVYNLMELRGEFGRLLLVLADVERREHKRDGLMDPWWLRKRDRKRVVDQLRRCLAVLEAE